MARGVPGTRASVPAVEVTEIHEIPDPLHIPDEAVAFFDGKGKRLCLASSQSLSIDQRSMINSFPLHEDDFDESPEAQRIKKMLVRSNFRPTPEGYFKRSDCILFTQTQGAYEDHIAQGELRFRQQISPDNVHGRMAELTDEIRATGLRRSGVTAEYDEYSFQQ